MHCVEFERRLNELLDDRLPLDCDPELAAHADECGQCAELLAGHELLVRGMAGLCCADDDFTNRRPSAVLVPADLAVRVAAQVGGTRTRRLSPWWMLPALAASILIAAAVYNGAHAKPVAKDATSDLSKEIAHSPVENPTSLSVVGWQTKWLKELGDSRYQWMDQVADGLKPVTDSMSAALHALRRTLPGAESGVRSSWSPAARPGEFVA